MRLVIAGFHVKYSHSCIVGPTHHALRIRAELNLDACQRLFCIGVLDKNQVTVCLCERLTGHLFSRLLVRLCFCCLHFRLRLVCPLLRLLLRCFHLRFCFGLRFLALVSSAGAAAAHKERCAQADHNNGCHILFHNEQPP